MYKSIFILVFICTSTFINLCKCENAKDENSLKSNGPNGSTTASVAFAHQDDSQNQYSTHRVEDVKVHQNYTPVNRTGSKVPPWDYARHGSDWNNGMCKLGVKQSPVDLHVEGLLDGAPTNLKAIYQAAMRNETPDLSYNPWRRGDVVYSYNKYLSTVQVLRSPNVFRLTLPANEGSTFGTLFTTDKPNLYVATHIDFHSPSEHTFEGSANRRQIEMQIWHYLNDSPSSDLGIGSMDAPETTETTMVVPKDVKKDTLGPSVTVPNPSSFFTTKDTKSPNYQSTTVGAAGTQKQTPHTNQTTLSFQNSSNNTTTKKFDSTHLGHTSGTTGGLTGSLTHHSGTSEGSKAGASAYYDYDHDEHEYDFDTDEHDPSMVQLGQKVASSDEPHPLASETSATYRRIAEKDRYNLFTKYLLTHLNKSSKNVNAERMHVKDKNMARDKNTHWGRWAVISLTFMSEEIKKTNIEKLREYASERFMNEVFKAGSAVNVTDNDDYPSVGDLNTGRPQEPLPVVDLDTPLNLSSLFMMLEVKNLNYFAYDGSFTQPGCEETVRWYVAKESLPISTELMLQLHRMLNPNPHVSNPNNYVDNYRELQNVNQKCRNVGNVRFVHGYPLEYFVISPFSQTTQVSGFAPARIFLILATLLFLILPNVL